MGSLPKSPYEIILGLDPYTMSFPEVIPGEEDWGSTYPLWPFPNEWSHVKADLMRELAQAQPDAFGRRGACVLVGADEGYGGHSTADVTDGYAMALNRLPRDTPLYGVLAVATGGSAWEKHALPSGADYEKLAPQLVADARFGIIPPHDANLCRIIPALAFMEVYQLHDMYEFTAQTALSACIEAIRNTNLTPRDCEFVGQLRMVGLAKGVHYYLTGSSAGIGGPSILMRHRRYHDIDIIAVGDYDATEMTNDFEILATDFYGPLETKAKRVQAAGSGKVIDGRVYRGTHADIVIDFFAGRSLDDVLVRHEYLERGLMHRLS